MTALLQLQPNRRDLLKVTRTGKRTVTALLPAPPGARIRVVGLVPEQVVTQHLVLEPSLKQVGMFAVYLAVVLFRPRGLFGRL